jgi:hypothetical protein
MGKRKASMKKWVILISIMIIVFIGIMFNVNKKGRYYNYIGFWRVGDYFSIDGILEEYLTKEEAEEFRGEIIVYRKDAYIFRNKIYPFVEIDSNYFNSTQLKEYTKGSGTPGYDFSDLNITKYNIIREVWFSVAGDWTFGNSIFVLDSNKIIITHKGFFFIAEPVMKNNYNRL